MHSLRTTKTTSFLRLLQLFKGKFYHCKDASYPDVKSREDCERKSHDWVNKEYNFDNLAKVSCDNYYKGSHVMS